MAGPSFRPSTNRWSRDTASGITIHGVVNSLCIACSNRPEVSGRERSGSMNPLVRRSVTVFASTAVVTLLLTGGYPLVAQESKTTKSQSTKAKQAGKVEAPADDESAAKGKGTGRVAPPDPTH